MTMPDNGIARRAKFLLGALGVLVVVMLGFGVLKLLRDEGTQVAKDRLVIFLQGEVSRHERIAGIRCQEIHQGVRDLIAKDISPILDAYKVGGNWRLDLDGRMRRIEQLGALVEACSALQRNQVGGRQGVGSPISQNILVEVTALPVYVGKGLTADTCGATCVATHMNLIEASRDALVMEISS